MLFDTCSTASFSQLFAGVRRINDGFIASGRAHLPDVVTYFLLRTKELSQTHPDPHHKFKRAMEIPAYWQKFRDQHSLARTLIQVPEEDDQSGLGAEVNIFGDDEIIEEGTLFYPGIEAVKHGFVPVGGCDIGLGDPYFICVEEGRNGRLYRIYHDVVSDGDFSKAEAAVIVLERYEDLLNFRS